MGWGWCGNSWFYFILRFLTAVDSTFIVYLSAEKLFGVVGVLRIFSVWFWRLPSVVDLLIDYFGRKCGAIEIIDWFLCKSFGNCARQLYYCIPAV